MGIITSNLIIKKFRLDDVYIGMLVLILDVPINDLSSFYLNQHTLNIEAKTKAIQTKGIDNLFFIYEHTEFEYYWQLIMKNGAERHNQFWYIWLLMSLYIFFK